MNKIKVIKKKELGASNHLLEIAGAAVSEPNSKPRQIAETIENWVTNWRKRKEAENRRAFDEAGLLKLSN